jgi:hypothetical protein
LDTPISGIRDLKYRITEFTLQPIEIRFDKLRYNWKLEPTLFGALVDVEIWYESDNSPMKDAIVLVSGQQIPLVAHNRYSAQIPMLGLEKTIKLQIEKGGFDMIYDTQVIYNQPNLMFYSFVSVFGIIIITAIIIRSRYRRRVIAPPPPKPTLLEPSKLKLEETGHENISEYIERMEKYVAELNDLRAQGIIDEQTYYEERGAELILWEDGAFDGVRLQLSPGEYMLIIITEKTFRGATHSE